MTENSDAFNEAVGVILARLYDSFQSPVNLSMEDFAGSADPSTQQRYFDTVKWIADEGYIRIGHYLVGGAVSRVVLSQRGITLLGERLSSLQGSVTFGDRLRDIAKSGGKELFIPVIRELLIRGTQAFLPGGGT
jgi:hypothetical protein